MHLTCCEIARNELEHPSHDWHVQPVVKDQNAYPHWVERSSPGSRRSDYQSSNLLAMRCELYISAERAQFACSLGCSRKTAQGHRERIEFSKDRLEVLRLPLKPFENYVPEFAPWPERFAALAFILRCRRATNRFKINADVKCPFAVLIVISNHFGLCNRLANVFCF